jgi:hypothetical protein
VMLVLPISMARSIFPVTPKFQEKCDSTRFPVF